MMQGSAQDVFARRREELMRRIGPRAVAIIPGSRLQRRNSDVDHRFRQTSDLRYLTGFEEPEACAVLAPGRAERFVMFVPPRDPERETWTGRRLGVEGARTGLGADEAHPAHELRERLRGLVDGADELHFYIADDEPADRLVMSTVGALRAGERRGLRAPLRLVDLRATLHEMRLHKDAAELADLRRAVEITTEAHLAAMAAARGGVHEYEIEALVDYTFRRRGADGAGYGTIVGGGVNATVLHYIENSAPLPADGLLLIDAGAEFRGVTADVTRTFPVSGRFTAAQRRVYDVVLDVQKRLIALVRPGVTIDAIHERAVDWLTEHMVALGLLRGDVAELVRTEAYRRFYMHRTSHWLGMDVHDVGAYYDREGRSRALEPDMVITVEPGLYLPVDAPDLPEEWRGIGVRIEDDVLVTSDGHEVLTRAIPKDPADLERASAR